MGLALGRTNLGVAKQAPDHFQRGEGMAQIMDTDVRNVCLHAHAFPEPFGIDDRLARDIAREQEGVLSCVDGPKWVFA